MTCWDLKPRCFCRSIGAPLNGEVEHFCSKIYFKGIFRFYVKFYRQICTWSLKNIHFHKTLSKLFTFIVKGWKCPWMKITFLLTCTFSEFCVGRRENYILAMVIKYTLNEKLHFNDNNLGMDSNLHYESKMHMWKLRFSNNN